MLLDHYRRPITLANALVYKLWVTCLVTLAKEYVESRKVLSPEQESFRANHSCARAITRLSLCIEDAHARNKDIVLCYLDFKGAFHSHNQLVKVLRFLGLPEDFTRLVSNLYSKASMEFVTPHSHTALIGVRRGALQNDPLSPLIFDLVFDSLIR
jgi:hypothetical protein